MVENLLDAVCMKLCNRMEIMGKEWDVKEFTVGIERDEGNYLVPTAL